MVNAQLSPQKQQQLAHERAKALAHAAFSRAQDLSTSAGAREVLRLSARSAQTTQAIEARALCKGPMLRSAPPLEDLSELISAAYASSNTHSYCFGKRVPDAATAAETPRSGGRKRASAGVQARERRVEQLRWLNSRVLAVYGLAQPTLYWLSKPASPEGALAMLVVRRFDGEGAVSDGGGDDAELRGARSDGPLDLLLQGVLLLPWKLGWGVWGRLDQTSKAAGRLQKAFARANGAHRRIDMVRTDLPSPPQPSPASPHAHACCC